MKSHRDVEDGARDLRKWGQPVINSHPALLDRAPRHKCGA